MKKLLGLGLIFLILAPAVFADDAKVMPKFVGRLYVAPLFAFANGAYDDDGKYEKFDDGSVQVFNLGFALEFGINNWLTAAVQWVPGWTPWSSLEGITGSDKTNTNGVADLFAGAKIQILGANAPVKSEAMRFAVAPGVIIPLPGPDYEKELKKVMSGKDATLNNMDNHVLGAGARFYYDYIINENFFINLYNETLFYPLKGDLNDYGPYLAGAKAEFGGMLSMLGAIPGAGALIPILEDQLNKVSGEVDYKYKLTFEIEPVFSTDIAEGIVFSAGLPINYQYKPAYEFSLKGYDKILQTLQPVLGSLPPGMGDMIPDEKTLLKEAGLEGFASHILYINPNVSVFFMKLPLPIELKAQYFFPVWGESAMAQHRAMLQVRAYFAIGSR